MGSGIGWNRGRWAGAHGLRVKRVPAPLSAAIPTCLSWWWEGFCLLSSPHKDSQSVCSSSQTWQHRARLVQVGPQSILILRGKVALFKLWESHIILDFLTSLAKSEALATLAFISSRRPPKEAVQQLSDAKHRDSTGLFSLYISCLAPAGAPV